MSDLTAHEVLNQLLAGNWMILDNVVEAKMTRLDREAAIEETRMNYVHLAGYYNSKERDIILNQIDRWHDRK